MKNLKDIFSLVIITCFVLRLYTEAIKTVKFPDDLLLGAASAAYQVEGAWDEDGKGENIWDRMTHSRPEKISDRSNGDVACNGYHKTKGDVALLKDLGLQFYRFSLSWSRILPTGFSNKINQAGIDYYNSLINELLANNIMPMVTIYHFDLPQPLQDLGGFANPLIVRWFGDYAKIVFEYFGDRVKTWITINEPKQICEYGYGNGLLAPGIESPGIGNYVCTHHLLKAHAHAYHLYDKHYRPKQNGRIGLTVECAWSEPASQKNGDIDAADRRRQFDFGLYTNAVFHKNGDYPNIVKEFVAQRSKEEGFSHSRLPQFTNDEINFIKGSSDFFGLNHYTTLFVTDRQSDPIGDPSLDKDTRVESFQDDEWLTSSADYFKLVPWGFRNILKYIKTNYGDPEVYITENGFPDLGEIDDNNRIKYYNGNLQAMLEAVYQDKVQVKYYAAWSLTDNFEWLSGYTLKFGLYHVNFTDPAKTRTPKASARFYKELLSTRKIILENEELLHIEAVKTVNFPDDLLLGAASAAYQVEGAWDEDGKGENIWDRMTHSRPEKVSDCSNGDVACDAYHKTKEDVALLKDLGVQFYRFSLSWSRILPTGFPNKINQAGIDYYNDLINELIATNIIPMVTIYHWDLPQPLQDMGGFANPLIMKWFGDYAKIVFEHFGDRVKTWITMNEPKQICEYGYGNGLLAPGIESPGIGNYVCTHHLLKAHAHAYYLYDKFYRPKQNGSIGLVVECAWSEPASQKKEDIDAADRRRQFDFGLYTNPVFHKDGDYPKIVKEFVAQRSIEEGFSHSRLPEFTNDEINFIKGTSDFFGLNHYTTLLVKNRQSDPLEDPSLDKDTRVEAFQDDKWLTGAFDYFRLVPWGFRNILKYIKTHYGDPEVYITESGFPYLGELEDNNRIKYYNGNLQAMLEAVYQDKVKVKYFTAWSLTDNFEWYSGYRLKFGLYHVNFTDPTKPRTPKASAKFYKELLSTRKLIIENEEL